MNLNHPTVKFGKTGILLVNLGTPDSTSWFDIRKYLKEFLSDKRVIEVNPIIWQVILNLFILTFRPSKTAKAYKEIWMKDIDMSPLKYYTEMQTKMMKLCSMMTLTHRGWSSRWLVCLAMPLWSSSPCLPPTRMTFLLFSLLGNTFMSRRNR